MHCVILVEYKILVFAPQVQILSRMYPCKECADHFKEVLRYINLSPFDQSEIVCAGFSPFFIYLNCHFCLDRQTIILYKFYFSIN
jgi:hypothetical protein